MPSQLKVSSRIWYLPFAGSEATGLDLTCRNGRVQQKYDGRPILNAQIEMANVAIGGQQFLQRPPVECIRSRIAARLGWLGVELDPTANAAHAMRVSRPKSRVAVYVIPTDEELMIARHTLALLAARDDEKRRYAASV